MVEGHLEFGQAHGVVATGGGEIDILAMAPAQDLIDEGCGHFPVRIRACFSWISRLTLTAGP
jgi:hypothetical protein